jgi:hypothetical protein
MFFVGGLIEGGGTGICLGVVVDYDATGLDLFLGNGAICGELIRTCNGRNAMTIVTPHVAGIVCEVYLDEEGALDAEVLSDFLCCEPGEVVHISSKADMLAEE